MHLIYQDICKTSQSNGREALGGKPIAELPKSEIAWYM